MFLGCQGVAQQWLFLFLNCEAMAQLRIRVSQEFFQTMATPKFSAFGYLKMEFIEKNKNIQI